MHAVLLVILILLFTIHTLYNHIWSSLWNWTTAFWSSSESSWPSFHGQSVALRKKLWSVWQPCPFQNRRVQAQSEINYPGFPPTACPSEESWQHAASLPVMRSEPDRSWPQILQYVLSSEVMEAQRRRDVEGVYLHNHTRKQFTTVADKYHHSSPLSS